VEYSFALLSALAASSGDWGNFYLVVGFDQATPQSKRSDHPVMNLDYEWQRPYVAAVLETDRSKLSQRIAEAHTAIHARVEELNQGTPEEQMAIEFALSALKLLSREVAESKPRS
jgi:hypothetical protein